MQILKQTRGSTAPLASRDWRIIDIRERIVRGYLALCFGKLLSWSSYTAASSLCRSIVGALRDLEEIEL